MRRKQIKPAKRSLATASDGVGGNSDDFHEFDLPALLPAGPSEIIDTAASNNAGSSGITGPSPESGSSGSGGLFPVVKIETQEASLENEQPPLKMLKLEVDDGEDRWIPPHVPEILSDPHRSPNPFSTNPRNSTLSENCVFRNSAAVDVAAATGNGNEGRKSIISWLCPRKASENSGGSLLESLAENPLEKPEMADSESPLKRLERCVRAKNGLEGSFSKQQASDRAGNKQATSTASLPRQRATRSNSSVKLRFGNGFNKTSAADALGELSQLVHRIGSSKLPVSATTTPSNKCVPNSVTSHVFTCLKCAQRFDTLDQLVQHISRTRHFSHGSARNMDSMVPWESERAATNFQEQLKSPSFLAALLYAQNYHEVSQDLSRKNGD